MNTYTCNCLLLSFTVTVCRRPMELLFRSARNSTCGWMTALPAPRSALSPRASSPQACAKRITDCLNFEPVTWETRNVCVCVCLYKQLEISPLLIKGGDENETEVAESFLEWSPRSQADTRSHIDQTKKEIRVSGLAPCPIRVRKPNSRSVNISQVREKIARLVAGYPLVRPGRRIPDS